ncbi:MAG: SIMPL domain-containing protein [Flavobacteriales bacterium]
MKKHLFILIILLSNVAISQNNTPTTIIQPTIDVMGVGIVKVTPDEVTIKVQVEHKGQNPKELKQKNDFIINDVLAFIKSINIADKQVQTEYVRLNKNYDYQTKTYNFSANQSVSIYLKNLELYESLMNGLMERGINRIDGISFSASTINDLKSQARIKAMQNAKMKAEEYTKVLNQSIGKAVSISEFNNTNYPGPVNRKTMMMSSDASGMEQQTISVGEIEVITKVNVSFLLN